MNKIREPLTIDLIRSAHHERRDEIRKRLAEFDAVWKQGDDSRLWEEMAFCFFTGGCSAQMGMNSIATIRQLLKKGSQEEIAAALVGVHRYPNARARYVVESRAFLTEQFGMQLRKRLLELEDHEQRRDWLATEKGVKGLGYKEASHYLRNIGFKGYAILDKHVLNCLAELKIIDEPKPPNTRSRYLTIEKLLKGLAAEAGIDFDELDLVLWSMKTGKILK